jgi:hypothetical protein
MDTLQFLLIFIRGRINTHLPLSWLTRMFLVAMNLTGKSIPGNIPPQSSSPPASHEEAIRSLCEFHCFQLHGGTGLADLRELRLQAIRSHGCSSCSQCSLVSLVVLGWLSLGVVGEAGAGEGQSSKSLLLVGKVAFCKSRGQELFGNKWLK